MKHSITKKYTLLLSCLLFFTIATCWLINRTFLIRYYQQSKCESLEAVFEEIRGIVSELDESDGVLSVSDKYEIDRISSSNNVSTYIVDGAYYGYLRPVYPSGDSLSNDDLNNMKDRWRQYYPSSSRTEFNMKYDRELIKSGNGYGILKVEDTKMDLKYLDLISTYNGEIFIFLRTNYDSIEENVAISNEFLAYVGIITSAIGTIFMYFISRRIARPIQQLNDVAKSMANLDFETKYTITTQDELGELGNSINFLSEKLESTIVELKTANNELQNDIKKKTQIDEMRKEFLSNVTHELKTPIALIQGYAEGLQDNINEDEESKDFYCEVIIDEANKMNSMVKKLLTLNQLEFGNEIVEFARFDVVAVIRSVLQSTDILMKQKNIVLHFEGSDPVFVWADEYLVQEVLTNYISNAIHHVSGVNIIEVKLIRKENVIRIAVFNTGEKIPEEDIEKVWIKFYKVDKARTREYGGSGIGLSIVKAIMTSMNQQCGVVNHDTGVEFWFELDTVS